MNDASFIAAVVLAAGSSSRMGGVKKEYQKLESGDSVLGSSVRVFANIPSVQVIVIAVPQGGEAAARDALPSEYLNAKRPEILFVNGGSARRASVFNALITLAKFTPDYVLIHDGARPWVSVSLAENIIKEVKKHNAVIPILPLADTPKECAAGIVKRHLKRASIGIAQTPQGFKFDKIFNAHKKASKIKNKEFTDDAEIWGKFCGKVAVISGEPQNKKITFREDLN